MDEIGFVDWIVGRSSAAGRPVVVGPGDDAAVVSLAGPLAGALAGASVGAEEAGSEIVFTIDEVVEGTHFRLSGEGLGPRATGRDVGYKAMVASVSDIAAMGGEPLAAVAALAMRKGQAETLGEAVHEGLVSAGADCGCPLVGGNVTGTAGPVTLTVASIGRVPRGEAFLRSGARPGDALFVTGELGGSILGRHLRPVARFAESRLCRALGGVTAMMDVTDGLALDLWRLARASGVGAVLEAERILVSEAAERLSRETGRAPLDHALGDGEDYELLFTVEAARAAEFERSWKLGTRLSRVGEVLPAAEGLLLREGGGARPLAAEGYRHLA